MYFDLWQFYVICLIHYGVVRKSADSATGCFVPEGIDGAKLVKSLQDDFGVTLAVAQEIPLEAY